MVGSKAQEAPVRGWTGPKSRVVRAGLQQDAGNEAGGKEPEPGAVWTIQLTSPVRKAKKCWSLSSENGWLSVRISLCSHKCLTSGNCCLVVFPFSYSIPSSQSTWRISMSGSRYTVGLPPVATYTRSGSLCPSVCCVSMHSLQSWSLQENMSRWEAANFPHSDCQVPDLKHGFLLTTELARVTVLEEFKPGESGCVPGGTPSDMGRDVAEKGLQDEGSG